MRISRIKLLLWSGAAALLTGGVGVGAWAALTPVDVAVSVVSMKHSTTGTVQWASEPPSAAALQSACTLPLRRPLYDPPPPAAKPAAQLPPLKIRLVGTIIEPGHSQAMLLLPDGTMEFKGIGQHSGGAEILGINEKSITVRHRDRVIVLKVEQVN